MPAPKLYLSSTLKDLAAERKALTEVLGSKVAVSHSYRGSEHDLVTHCLDDVAGCEIFVLVLGLRYGYVPTAGFHNPKQLSITELEYECARTAGIPRFVFIKSEDAIPASQTDLRTKEHPAERIDDFRGRVGTGAGETPAPFGDISELKQAALEALLPHIERLRHAEGSGSQPDTSDLEAIRAGYCEWLVDECQRIVLLGLGARDRQNVRLGQVDVPALTHRQSDNAHEPGRARTRGAHGADHVAAPVLSQDPERQLEPVLHRLGRESLYVPGAPGSGKSTLCRWVALSVASGGVPVQSPAVSEPYAETLPESLNGRFPLLCPLREWSADKPWVAGNGQWHRPQLEAALAAWIETTRPGGLTAGAFRDVLEKGRAVLVLDGVDEIPERADAHYPRLNFLTGLADALPSWTKKGNRILLTSRPYGVETSLRAPLALLKADLLNIPRELQDVFVQRWFAAAGTKNSGDKATALIAHLDERSDLDKLDELRSNPMLLTRCV